MTVGILDTGLANLASVVAALRRIGIEPRVTRDPAAVETCEALVVPGVGSFSAAMSVLRRDGLFHPLQERLRSDLPTLGICLGAQLMGSASEEAPGVDGLGIIADPVQRLPAGGPRPQQGWAEVSADSQARFLRSGWAYFSNGYALRSLPVGWIAARARRDEEYVAGFERNRILGCQFHPELSGAWGQAIFRRWIEEATC